MSPVRTLYTLFIALFLALPRAAADDYYVSLDGDDINPGTLALPWRTIQHAANTMVAGDTVHIRGGTYVERVTPMNGGNATAGYITYCSCEDEVPVIRPPAGQAQCIALLYDRALSYLYFTGLTLSDATDAAFVASASGQPKSNIILDGITTSNSKWGIALQHGVTTSRVTDCTVTGDGTTASIGIYAYDNVDDVVVSGAAVNDCARGIYFANNVTNSQITACTATGPATTDTYGILLLNDVCGVDIAGNTVTDFHYNIRLFAGSAQPVPANIAITDNTVSYALSQGIHVHAGDHIYLARNYCHHNGASGIQIEGDGTTTVLPQYVIIEHNTCEYNATSALFHAETGIWVDDSDYVLVQNNVMRYNAIGHKITGCYNVICRFNTIYANNATLPSHPNSAGVWVTGTEQRETGWGEPGGDDVVVHNTVYENGAGLPAGQRAQVLLGDVWTEATLDDQARRIVFKNNIAAESQADCYDLDLWIMGYTHEIDYNNYCSQNGFLVLWQVVNHDVQEYMMNWSTYLCDNGLSYDAHSILTDPRFVSPEDANFELNGDSPCIDAGGHLTFATNDDADPNTLAVDDARYFSDGYDLIDGDWIQINGQVARVLNVDYDSRTLELDRPLSWAAHDAVDYPFAGDMPDMGAFEFATGTNHCEQPCDFDWDCDVDFDDFRIFEECASGPGVAVCGTCSDADLNIDGCADLADFCVFQRCFSGAGTPADPNCAD